MPIIFCNKKVVKCESLLHTDSSVFFMFSYFVVFNVGRCKVVSKINAIKVYFGCN